MTLQAYDLKNILSLPTLKHDLGLKSVPCTAEAFAELDAVLMATAHDQFKDPRL